MDNIEIHRIDEFRSRLAPDGCIVFTITTVAGITHSFDMPQSFFIELAAKMADDAHTLLASADSEGRA